MKAYHTTTITRTFRSKMLEETLSYYKSKLKHSEKSGPQFVTIENVKKFADENGNELLYKDRFGYVFTFKNENLEHEELYWCAYPDVEKKLMKVMNLYNKSGNPLIPTDTIGKKLWIVIRHNITIDDKQNEVKRESEIVHYSADEQMPNYPQVLEEYDIAAV